MSSRVVPQHAFVPGQRGKCGGTVNAGRGPQACNLPPSHPCHRLYPCRTCTVVLLSVESRDRHEADEHGPGW